MSGLRAATLAARFLSELAMLAALAFWGFTLGDGLWAWLLGLGAPTVAAAALAAAGQPVAALVLGVAGLVISLLNESQERREGPETIRRR